LHQRDGENKTDLNKLVHAPAAPFQVYWEAVGIGNLIYDKYRLHGL